MVPVVALSAIGLAGVVQRYRDAGVLSDVVAQAGRVEHTLAYYAGLVDERSGSESIMVAAASNVSSAEASSLTGYDITAQLRRGRAEVDAALLTADGTALDPRVTQMRALRARIDTGRASASEVRSFFNGRIAAASAMWNVDLAHLTEVSLRAVDSSEFRRAAAGLADSVAAFIAGTKALIAAGALTAPGVPGKATGLPDLAAANALYAHATTRLRTELRGHAAATHERLIVTDRDVHTFQKFIDALIATPPGQSVTLSIPELGRTFRNGLLLQNHLRRVVRAASAEVAPIALRLHSSAHRALVRYLLALGIIAACSAALAITTARKIVTPLHRLGARAARASSGTIDDDFAEPDGPYEVAMVTAAFNEIVANLTALDASARALASGDLDSPALTKTVPGRIGDSLQHSVDRLHESLRANEELRKTLVLSEARFRDLADHSPDIVLHLSREPELHIDYVSPSFEALAGVPAAAIEADIRILADRLDHETRAKLADAAAGRALPSRFDTTFRRPALTDAVFDVRVVETKDGLQAIGRDVTEVRALQTQLAQQATQDPLTGLANRRLLDELLPRALRRASRAGNSLTVMFLDLDNFKSVNDAYGHDAGDTVLRVIATRLQTVVRDADVIARYGGDEFVIASETADDNADRQLADRIERVLGSPIDVGNGVMVRCPPSIGISGTRTTVADAATLIAIADHGMLEIKMARNRAQSLIPS